MRYAQFKNGQKLHLVYEPGEGKDDSNIIRAGQLSAPLCGRIGGDRYRMTIGFPLNHACQNCQRVYRARHAR